MDPRITTIRGSCKADIRSAAIKEAAHLECRNDRAAKSKGARLDFRLVITSGIGERVTADLDVARCKGKGSGREGKYEGKNKR